jgi:hypothetical protein
MCLLVLLFATQTKTALYKRPSVTVRTLAASKFWKNRQTQNVSIPEFPKPDSTALALALIFLALPLLKKMERVQEPVMRRPALRNLDAVHLFHRHTPRRLYFLLQFPRSCQPYSD